MAMLNNQRVIHLIPSWSHTRARAFFWEVRVSKNAQLAVCFSLLKNLLTHLITHILEVLHYFR